MNDLKKEQASRKFRARGFFLGKMSEAARQWEDSKKTGSTGWSFHEGAEFGYAQGKIDGAELVFDAILDYIYGPGTALRLMIAASLEKKRKLIIEESLNDEWI
jgi:hypothetical protein